ncbi:enoyl-CoA hydratase/isomerase family protein [Mycobacterium sp. SMC-2]|uniref:enoyl-CoA hydratase/isomerase family protein n=1 Tax=Mycobacterium sp. SMC-2 TaxID=2857058 RepID=UPI0021B475A7|nr:enoyl-CoA hydratase-related protein [Mycobacterium sp. SMC-2]UXA06129.1 enoyl-CoA hydratase/isomerase family protein [Mycobacterium sp. SMC-2]
MPNIVMEKRGHTTIFTINKPDRMNAIGLADAAELEAGLSEFQSDPDQYVAIITAAGDKAFCAGADLKAMATDVDGGGRLPISPAPDIAGVAACEKVTIAAINGLAAGTGTELAISCDIRIAVEDAWFGLPEVKRGIVAGVAVNVLPRLMPIGAVMELMLTGDRLTADEAFRLGLVQRVVARERLIDTALERAETIAKNSQAAVWGTKQILKFWRDALIAEQQRYYEAVVHRVMLSGDVHEGPRAFAEKREPKFRQAWLSPYD